MLLCLRAVFLIISLMGISFFVYDKLRINPTFVPLTALSAIVCFIYISGLLNILRLCVYLLFAFSVICFAIYLLKISKKELDISVFWCPGVIFFALLTVYFFILLNGLSLTQYDNFSHWGLIVKEMFYYNSFPDDRTIVIFRNYPPGTASLIYYICKILGYNEGNMLIAQSLIIPACLATLFCKAKFKNMPYLISLTAVCIASICIMGYGDSTLNMHNLMVDAVLAFVAAASIIIAYYYKNNIKKLFFSNLIVLSSLCLIKDSGKIFLIIICLFIFMETTNYLRNITKEKILYSFILLIVPIFLSSTLWKAYNEKAYQTYEFSSNKFVFSLDWKILKEYLLNNFVILSRYALGIIIFAALVFIMNFVLKNHTKIKTVLNALVIILAGVATVNIFIKAVSIFSPNSQEDLDTILFRMRNYLLDPSIINNKLFLLVNVMSILTIVLLFALKRINKLIVKSFLYTNILVIFYVLNLYVLYAIIMNRCEGIEISAFDRYLSTVIIIVFLIQSLAIIHVICNVGFSKPLIPNIISFSLGILALTAVNRNLYELFKRPDIANLPRYPVQQACNIARRYLSRNENVVIYLDNGASRGYNGYLSMYELLSKNCHIIDNDNIKNSNIIENISSGEYLLIATNDEIFWSAINSLEILVDNQNGSLYKISNFGNNLCLNRVDV